MERNSNINFHQSFKPEKQYIGSILDIASKENLLRVQDISAYTGIPNGKISGKVVPHIYYAQYMGLVNVEKKDGAYRLEKTELGNLVSFEDPDFQEKLTILLCHAMLLRKNNGAHMWNAIFMQILPFYQGEVKKEIALKELDHIFDGKASKKNFAPFLGAYENMFAELNLLKIDIEKLSILELPYDKEFVFLYAYILLEYWDELYPEQVEISSTRFAKLNYGKAFGWNEEIEYATLEHLADKGILRLNKQLVPYTIVRMSDKKAVMENLYSELC